MNTKLYGMALGAILCAIESSQDRQPPVVYARLGAQRGTITPRVLELNKQRGDLERSSAAAMDAGNYAEAEADARQSVSLGAAGRGRELLASALYAQGKDQEALQVYKQIADAGANAGRNEWPYALLLLKAGQWPQAVQAYDVALTLGGDVGVLRAASGFSPAVPRPTELRAAILIGWATSPSGGSFHGDYYNAVLPQAQAMYAEALSLAPDSAVAHYYYGCGLRRMGRTAEAQAAFQKAADLGSGDVRTAAEAALKGR